MRIVGIIVFISLIGLGVALKHDYPKGLIIGALATAFLGCAISYSQYSAMRSIGEGVIEIQEDVTELQNEIENMKGKELAEEHITAEDSALVKDIIQKLKGIEKFTVKNDFELLSSLLAFKGDHVNHAKVEAILKRSDYWDMYGFRVLDMRNGYSEYIIAMAEGGYTVTYWNMDDGSKLIATEGWSCGPACDSDLRFEKYQNGIYESIENQEIIPEIRSLHKMLLSDYDPAPEVYGIKYKLPRRGKNIRFCLSDGFSYEKCVELEWQNGIFKINEK